jgi:uncharacterized membrane protein
MTWYHAADGKQAGPFTEEQFRELIANGTLQPATLVWEARLPNWLPLSQVPAELLPAPAIAGAIPGAPPIFSAASVAGGVICSECGRTFAPDEVIRIADRNVCASCKPILVQRLSEGAAPASVPGLWVNEQELLQREYRIELGSCLERAWKAITSNLGPVILSSLLYVLMMLGVIAVIGAVFAIGFSVAGIGPARGGGNASMPTIVGLVIVAIGMMLLVMVAANIIIAGYAWFYLNLVRNGQANYSEIFVGFRRQFGSLLAALLVQTMISIALTIPFTFATQFIKTASSSAVMTALATLVMQLISSAISLYLWAIWLFAMLLILDKRMPFWSAMQLSRKMVSKRIWMTLLFLLIAVVIACAGIFACVVGLLVTVPFLLAMRAALYEDNFHDLLPTQTSAQT